MTEVVPEAYELVEHGLLDENDFRDFVFDERRALLGSGEPGLLQGHGGGEAGGGGARPTQMKRRVALIGTGGTISSIGRGSLDLWEYMDTSRKAEPEELLVRFPEAAEAAEIVPVRFRSVGSAAIGPGDWLALAAAVSDATRQPQRPSTGS